MVRARVRVKVRVLVRARAKVRVLVRARARVRKTLPDVRCISPVFSCPYIQLYP